MLSREQNDLITRTGNGTPCGRIVAPLLAPGRIGRTLRAPADPPYSIRPDTPYETRAPALPKSLREAASALRVDEALCSAFGGAFVNY